MFERRVYGRERRGTGAGMFAIPVGLLIVLAIVAIAWSPVFAVIVAGFLFVAFLAYAGLRPRVGKIRQP